MGRRRTALPDLLAPDRAGRRRARDGARGLPALRVAETEAGLSFDFILKPGVSSQRLGMKVLEQEGIFDRFVLRARRNLSSPAGKASSQAGADLTRLSSAGPDPHAEAMDDRSQALEH